MTRKIIESLDDFVMDDDTRNLIKFSIKAAHKKGEPLKHILLTGAGGLGKSTLARLIAKEYNLNGQFLTEYGPNMKNNITLINTIRSLNDGDVLFIDEFHSIKDLTIHEMLYSVMQDQKINIKVGKSSLQKKTAKFTLIAATTDKYKLTDSCIGRFPIKIDLLPYDKYQLIKMINSYSEKFITQDAAIKISKISHGIARLAVESIDTINLYADANDISTIDSSTVDNVFGLMKIDNFGLSQIQRDYLKVLSDNFNKCLSIGNLETLLNKPRQELERFVEPLLIELGLIEKTTGGRNITQKGLDLYE
jgi:holliday junction DNA helicase RuvB